MSTPARVEFPRERTEELWREFAAPLRSFLRGRTRSSADAEDLLQDVFIRIQRRLPTLRDTSKMQGWIYRIARNALIDHYRSRREQVPIDLEVQADDPAGESTVDLRPSLRRFMAELPAHYREPLVRHEFQGESIGDVAAALGLTLTATKSRVRRARLMLREMLDRCCRFEFDRRGRVIGATPRSACRCEEAHDPARPSPAPLVTDRFISRVARGAGSLRR